MTDRRPPHDTDAEESLLGSCLLSVGAISAALTAGITPTDFYSPQHGHIWTAIVDTHTAGDHADVIAVASRLNGHLGPDGLQRLRHIEAATPSSANAPAYARIVRRHARARELLAAASELERRMWAGDEPGDILTHLLALSTATECADEDTWAEIDLTAALAGHIERPQPCILTREDGHSLFYPGRVNGIHGDSGIGKSMLTTYAAAQQLDQGHHVGWVDFEEPDETVVIERLRMLNIDAPTITNQFHYYRPQDPFGELAVHNIATAARDQAWTLLVIDSLGEAFGLESINEDKDVEVGPWLRRVPRTLADAGPAVVTIDHATKASDNPLHPSGSKRKRAAITGASYLIEAPSPLTRDHGGQLRVKCAKDRHGNYQRGKEVGLLDLTPGDTNTMTFTFRGPGSADPWTGPTHCIEAAIEVLESVAPDELSTTQIIKALAERGKSYRKQTVISALGMAVESGHLTTRSGPRGSVLYRASESDNQGEIF